MAWVRRRYRRNKVWIEVDEGGSYVVDARGLARLRYKPEDDRTYSVKTSEISVIEAEAEVSAEALVKDPDAPEAAPKKSARAPRPPRPKAVKEPAAVDPGDAGSEDGDIAALAGLEIQAWTDGASSGNPGPAGAGVVLIFREHRKELSLYLGETTNNVAELTAVREALRLIRRRDVPVRVHTDSTYVIGVLSGSMKAKMNADLVAEIRDEMRSFPDLKFVKVPAHAGVELNERADALAGEAIRSHRSRTK